MNGQISNSPSDASRIFAFISFPKPELASKLGNHYRPLILIAMALMASVASTRAAQSVWQNTGDGTWTNSANWSLTVPGVPGSVQSPGGDTPTFSPATGATMPVLSADYSVAQLIIDNTLDDYSIQRQGTPILSVNGITINGGGATTIDPVVRLTNGQTWNTGSTALTLNNGLQVNTASILTLANSGTVEVKGVLQGFNTTITGNSNSPSASASSLILSGSGNLLVSGVIQNNGLGTSTTGITAGTGFSGTLTVTNANNTFTGAVAVQGGTLAVGATGALGNTSVVNLGAGGSTNPISLLTTGAFTVDRNIAVLSTSAVAPSIGGSQTSGTSTYSGSIALGRSATLTAASGGTVDFTNVISTTANNAGVTVSGGGVVRLTGSNTYTGGTTLTAGTLLVNNTAGSGLGTGGVTVNSGTLGGTGRFTGAVSVNSGGILAPGASIESLGSGALTFNSGSTFGYEVDSSAGLSVGADLQVVSGALSLNGPVTLSLSNLSIGTFGNATTFTLINYSGAWNGGLFTFNGNNLADDSVFTFNGQSWLIDYNATAGGTNFSSEFLASSNYVNITAVPEPSVFALAGIGLLFLGLYVRCRKAAVIS